MVCLFLCWQGACLAFWPCSRREHSACSRLQLLQGHADSSRLCGTHRKKLRHNPSSGQREWKGARKVEYLWRCAASFATRHATPTGAKQPPNSVQATDSTLDGALGLYERLAICGSMKHRTRRACVPCIPYSVLQDSAVLNNLYPKYVHTAQPPGSVYPTPRPRPSQPTPRSHQSPQRVFTSNPKPKTSITPESRRHSPHS